MQQAGPGRRVSHDLWYHIYIIPVQTVLKDATEIAYALSLFFSSAFSHKVKASGSV